ncbi:MAG: alanine racemase [Desulfovibrio sp.]
MTISYNKLRVQVDLDNIRHNYRILKNRGSDVFGVIKADAYGHGLVEVGKAIADEGCTTFAVGTVDEAVQLIEGGVSGRIIALLGPVDEQDFLNLFKYDVVPFIGNIPQLERLVKTFDLLPEELKGATVRISVKLDTGMARLGFRKGDMPRVIELLQENPRIVPELVSSHLATADDPEQFAYVEKQGERFEEMYGMLRDAGFNPEPNIANSAGLIKHDVLHHACQRGGIALYGCDPLKETAAFEDFGFKPAMEVTTKVMQVHSLPKGETVSYGRTFRAKEDMQIAFVGAGYADAYSRGLSNKGYMCLHGKRVPIVGRVCMQLTAVDITALVRESVQVQVGDDIHLLGGEGEGRISPEELADWWGTITYEVFCLLGLNPKDFSE